MKIKTDRIFWKTIAGWAIGLVSGGALGIAGTVCYIRANLITVNTVELPFHIAVSQFPDFAMKDWRINPEFCALPPAFHGERATNFSLCCRPLAQQILSIGAERKTAAVIPCRISIYEGDDGQTYTARLNLHLLSFLLGGKAGQLLREEAVPQQNAMLERFLTGKRK